MEWIFGNSNYSTNNSGHEEGNFTELDDEEFIDPITNVFIHTVIFLLCFLAITLDILCLIAIIVNTTGKVNKMLQVALGNILASGIVYATGIGVIVLGYPFRLFDPSRRPETCTAGLFFQITGGTASVIALAEFGIIIHLIIKHGKKKLNNVSYVLLIAVSWLFSIGSASIPFLPQYGLTFRESSQSRCSYQFEDDVVSLYVHFAITWGVLGSLSCIATAVLTLNTYLHIRKNAISAAGSTNPVHQALIKLAAYLTTTLSFFVLGLLVTPLLTFFVEEDEGIGDAIVYYFPYFLFILFAWPTPIAMLAVNKAIRQSFKNMLKCICKKRNSQVNHDK